MSNPFKSLLVFTLPLLASFVGLMAYGQSTRTVPADTFQFNMTGNHVNLTAPSPSASYSLALPPAQGAANSLPLNNGSGVLSWLVAASANTASTLVQRDASGNFTAGSITATLIGNASNVSGTVATANGGTGLTAAGSAGNVLTSDGSNWTSAPPATSGTVSSVGLSAPSIFSVSGSPVTTSGTLALSYSGTALPIANGGTGATTAPGALTSLGAAASGANSDITSLAGLTTPLSVAQGGSGATTLGSNSVLLGNGTGAMQSVAPGSSANVLTSTGSTWVSAALPPSGLATSPKATSFTAASFYNYLVDTTGGAVTATLPTGAAGQVIQFTDAASNWGTANLTIAPAGGDTIQGVTGNLVANLSGAFIQVAWDSTLTVWTVSGSGFNTFQDASATQPGIVSTGTQTFAGDKTFQNNAGNSTILVTGNGVSPAGQESALVNINSANTTADFSQVSFQSSHANNFTLNSFGSAYTGGFGASSTLAILNAIGINIVTLTQSGNVGIGTTSPQAALEVYTASTNNININGPGATYIQNLKAGSLIAYTYANRDTIADGGTIHGGGQAVNVLIHNYTNGIGCNFSCASVGCSLVGGPSPYCDVSGSSKVVCTYQSGAVYCHNYLGSAQDISVYAQVVN